MPIAEHSIEVLDEDGDELDPAVKFTFLNLLGAPQLGQEKLERWERAGIDGPGYRKIGKRGIPFQLTSIIDVETIGDGLEGYQVYLTAAGHNPCRLIKDGEDWGVFKVIGVQLASLSAIGVGSMIGGLGATAEPPYVSGALLACHWALEWIADPEEAP